MRTDPEQVSTPETQPITSLSVFGARLTWSVLGPLALALVTLGIVMNGNGWLTALDALFAAVVLWMMFGRWFEQRSGQATLATGEPSTPAHFRRYVAGLFGAALAVFVVSNVLGNHVL